jgi:hypothetical protein
MALENLILIHFQNYLLPGSRKLSGKHKGSAPKHTGLSPLRFSKSDIGQSSSNKITDDAIDSLSPPIPGT